MRRKRFLWVIGVSDGNLGQSIYQWAINGFKEDEDKRYDNVYATDEVCDVSSDVHLMEKAKSFIAANDDHAIMDVVYCAGVNELSPIKHLDENTIWNTFNVNVMGFIRLLNVLTNLRDVDVNVVAIASDAARNPMRNSITYCASKAALVQAMRVAARELAPGYRVNTVSPAIIHDTPMTLDIDVEVQHQRGWTYEELREYERSQIPMGRRAWKYEIAQVVLQTLVGPEFLTGSNIEITGGK